MRRAIGLILLIWPLSGCGTPQGVTDTASLVAKMSTQLDGQMKDYVNGINSVRADDAQRLSEMHARADLLAKANQDQFSSLELAGDQDASKLLTAIQSNTADSPNIGQESQYLSQLQADFGKVSFDGSALADISTIAGAIAKPSTSEDEIKTLGAFGQQVYQDLKKSNPPAK